MTEEIIIDGVNVAGCGAYKDKHCIDKTSIIFCDTNLCSNYPYCYYKQLKRLEQENKALKEKFEQYKSSKQKSYETLQKRLNDAEWEKRELEQENENLKEVKGWMGNNLNFALKDVDKYKKALEEIKEKVKNPITLSCFASAKFVLEQIDKKINEVLK